MENTAIQKVQLPELAYYSFNEYVEQVKKGVALVTAQQPKDPKSLAAAVDTLAKAKQLRQHMEKKLEELTRPAKDTKKAIDEWQRALKERVEEVITPLNQAADALNKAIVAYDKVVREEAMAKAKADQRVASIVALGVTMTPEEEADIRVCSDQAYNSMITAINEKIAAEKRAELDRLNEELRQKAEANQFDVAEQTLANRKAALIHMGFTNNGRGFVKGEIEVAPVMITDYSDVQWSALMERIQMETAREAQKNTPVTIIPDKPKGMTTIWKYDIVDENAIPRQYCIPSPGLLQEAVRSGARDIPGVRIFEETKLR